MTDKSTQQSQQGLISVFGCIVTFLAPQAAEMCHQLATIIHDWAHLFQIQCKLLFCTDVQ